MCIKIKQNEKFMIIKQIASNNRFDPSLIDKIIFKKQIALKTVTNNKYAKIPYLDDISFKIGKYPQSRLKKNYG